MNAETLVEHMDSILDELYRESERIQEAKAMAQGNSRKKVMVDPSWLQNRLDTVREMKKLVQGLKTRVEVMNEQESDFQPESEDEEGQ